MIFKFFIVFCASFLLGACAAQKATHSKAIVGLVEKADKEYRQGLLSNAETSYLKITKDYPLYHEAWLKLGNIYSRTGQLEAAIKAYQVCLKKNKEDFRCWNNLALVQVKQAMSTLEQGKSYLNGGGDSYYMLDSFHQKLIKTMSVN